MIAVRPPIPRLMLVTDRHRSHLPLPTLAAAAVVGGCDAVQVRDKDLNSTERRCLARSILDAAGSSTVVLINEDVHLARELGVGVHLPEGGCSAAKARRILGDELLVGRSVHSIASAEASKGADFLVAGSVFATRSHPDGVPIGLDGLKAIVRATPLPVLAIGGITAERIAAVVAAGAYGVAVIDAISTAPTREHAVNRTRRLRQRIGGARPDQEAT